MAVAAVLTPLAASLVRADPAVSVLGQYLLLVAFVFVTLLFREASKRLVSRGGLWRVRGNDGPTIRRLRGFVLAEGVSIVALAGLLSVVAGPIWLLGVLAIPLVAADLAIRRRGWPVPFGGELSGVATLSLVVPAGATLLDVGGTVDVLLLWVLFGAFHVGSVLRVGMVLTTDGGSVSRAHLFAGLVYHGVLVVAVTAAWVVNLVGPVAPVLFAVAGLGAAWSTARRNEPVEFKTLGRDEGVLSTLFVLGVPWLFP